MSKSYLSAALGILLRALQVLLALLRVDFGRLHTVLDRVEVLLLLMHQNGEIVEELVDVVNGCDAKRKKKEHTHRDTEKGGGK